MIIQVLYSCTHASSNHAQFKLNKVIIQEEKSMCIPVTLSCVTLHSGLFVEITSIVYKSKANDIILYMFMWTNELLHAYRLLSSYFLHCVRNNRVLSILARSKKVTCTNVWLFLRFSRCQISRWYNMQGSISTYTLVYVGVYHRSSAMRGK